MEDARVLTIVGGALVGAAFGAIVQRSNFCIMGAVADYALSGDQRRMREWMLAIAAAIASTQLLQIFFGVDLSQAFFRAPELPLGGLIVGGLLFGFGMVIACGCVSRSLVNAASGDLRALVTVGVIGVFAYVTLHGVLAAPRVWFNRISGLNLENFGIADSGLGAMSEHIIGMPAWLIACAVTLALAIFALGGKQRPQLFAPLSIGVLVGAGWCVTGVVGVDEFEPQPLLSLRFVAPTGDSLQYLMLSSGTRMSFGVATVAGVVAGAFASAVLSGNFRLKAFEDLHDMRRYLTGGAFMGIGGVLALGCTVGQGMSGLSTLALGSFIATSAIIAGGIFGVRYLEEGSLVGALGSVFGRTYSNSISR